MVRVLALVALMLVAQPVAATQVIQVAASADDVRSLACTPDAPACVDAVNAKMASKAAVKVASPGYGSIIAGLTGILVLSMVFGRRKSGLPEVVS